MEEGPGEFPATTLVKHTSGPGFIDGGARCEVRDADMLLEKKYVHLVTEVSMVVYFALVLVFIFQRILI